MMKCGIKVQGWFLASLVLLVCQTALAAVVCDQGNIHPAYNIESGGPENEGGEYDGGGVIMLFLRNTGTGDESIDLNNNAWIDNTRFNDVTGFRWARLWPEVIQPGQTSTLLIKGLQSPIAPYSSAHVKLTFNSGSHVDYVPDYDDIPVKVSHVVPSRDYKTLYIFLRNQDPSWYYQVEQVFVAGQDKTSDCTFVGGDLLAVNNIKIIKVAFPGGLNDGDPLPIRIELAKGDGYHPWIGAFVRVMPPEYWLGTWHGDAFTSEQRAEECREFGFNFVGPDRAGDWSFYGKYFLYGLPQPGNPADIGEILYNLGWEKNNPMVFGYYVVDEPTVGGDQYSPEQIFTANHTCWKEGNNKGTMINLARAKAMQKYAYMADYPCSDHYCQFAPLVYGGFNTTYSIKNAYRYTWNLKKNTEPARTWAYCQGVSHNTGWRDQPTTWGIKVQFWSHILAGAKTIKWFRCYDESGYSNQFNSIRQVTREATAVRGALLYGDVIDNVWVSHGDMLSRMIVSEDTVVVPVVNGSGWYYNGIWPDVGMSDLTGQSIEFDVPSHIPIERIKRVTQNGLEDVAYTQNGNHIRIFDIHLTQSDPHQVYLVGKNDTTPPEVVQGVNVARTDGSTAILSWKDALDNVGIRKYRVLRNGSILGETPIPMFHSGGHNSTDEYIVLAVDDADNQSFSIQAEIDMASPGSIIYIPPGTYLGEIDFRNKDVILEGDINNPTQVVLQGTGSGPVVTFGGAESNHAGLRGLSITGGNTNANGGGICGNSTNATISNCLIYGNHADNYGGGIDSVHGPIQWTSVWSNSASQEGGGLARCNGLINAVTCCYNSANHGGGMSHCYGTVTNCRVYKNTASSWGGGLHCVSGVLQLTTVAANSAGDGGGLSHCTGMIAHCIIWDNNTDPLLNCSLPSYSCYYGASGLGNFTADPLFANPDADDWHLQSQAGRLNPLTGSWEYDDCTSPCIDAGHPWLAPLGEPAGPYNTRLNLGTWGNTGHASANPAHGKKLADIDNSSVVDTDDLAVMGTQWLYSAQGLNCDISRDNTVNLHDFSILASQWSGWPDIAYDGDFESGGFIPGAGWFQGNTTGQANIISGDSSGYGAWCLQYDDASAGGLYVANTGYLIQPGDEYQFSIDIKAMPGYHYGGDIILEIRFINEQYNAVLGSVTEYVPVQFVTPNWTTYTSAIDRAPAGSYYMDFQILPGWHQLSSGSVRFDNLVLTQANSVRPLDGDCETQTVQQPGWVALGPIGSQPQPPMFSTEYPARGRASLKFVCSPGVGGGLAINAGYSLSVTDCVYTVTPGREYALTWDARKAPGFVNGGDVTIQLRFLDASYTPLELLGIPSAFVNLSTTPTLDNTWQSFYGSLVAPAEAVYWEVIPYIGYMGTSSTSGGTLYLDNFKVTVH